MTNLDKLLDLIIDMDVDELQKALGMVREELHERLDA